MFPYKCHWCPEEFTVDKMLAFHIKYRHFKEYQSRMADHGTEVKETPEITLSIDIVEQINQLHHITSEALQKKEIRKLQLIKVNLAALLHNMPGWMTL